MAITYHAGRRIQGTQADFDGTPAVSGGWKELGRTTLGSATSTMSVSSLPDKRYYQVLLDMTQTIDSNYKLRLNNDTGSNYAFRFSNAGGSDNTSVSQTSIDLRSRTANEPTFWNGYIANLDSKEKLSTFLGTMQGSTGAGTAPSRTEQVGKWVNTSDSIDQIGVTSGSGNLASGSEVVILGYDPDDTHTDNFWEELASVDLSGGAAATLSTGTFTNKKYLWVQVFLEMGTTQIPSMRINNVSTGTPYASRYSNNGGADATDTSQNQIALANYQTENTFANYFFVNDGSNEALGICHAMVQNTAGAANAPSRAERVIKDAGAPTITRFDWGNFAAGSGNYGTNSIVKVWGSN
jgi:hypothetical protein